MNANETFQQFCQRIREVVNACAEGEIIEGAIAGEWLEAQDGWMGFHKGVQYRVKKTFPVNGFDVPVPESDELPLNARYYIPDILSKELYREDIWGRTKSDMYALNRHLIHINPSHAIMHAKALLMMNPYLGEDHE